MGRLGRKALLSLGMDKAVTSISGRVCNKASWAEVGHTSAPLGWRRSLLLPAQPVVAETREARGKTREATGGEGGEGGDRLYGGTGDG